MTFVSCRDIKDPRKRKFHSEQLCGPEMPGSVRKSLLKMSSEQIYQKWEKGDDFYKIKEYIF